VHAIRTSTCPSRTLASISNAFSTAAPKVLLHDKEGYRLEHATRLKLDAKYGRHETTIAVSNLLKELPGKISGQAEKLFLSEAITCYHHRAFRAAIVMAWNLAYDHLLNPAVSLWPLFPLKDSRR
jgi:hypothetical protein